MEKSIEKLRAMGLTKKDIIKKSEPLKEEEIITLELEDVLNNAKGISFSVVDQAKKN